MSRGARQHFARRLFEHHKPPAKTEPKPLPSQGTMNRLLRRDLATARERQHRKRTPEPPDSKYAIIVGAARSTDDGRALEKFRHCDEGSLS